MAFEWVLASCEAEKNAGITGPLVSFASTDCQAPSIWDARGMFYDYFDFDESSGCNDSDERNVPRKRRLASGF